MKLVFLVLFFSVITGAQTLNKFVLVKTNNTRIEGTAGKITDTIFEGVDAKGKNFSTPINEIDKLYEAKSNKAVLFGILGMVTGSVVGLALGYDAQTSEFVGGPEVVMGTGALGTLIGVLVGSNMYDWELMNFKTKSSIGYNSNNMVYPENWR